MEDNNYNMMTNGRNNRVKLDIFQQEDDKDKKSNSTSNINNNNNTDRSRKIGKISNTTAQNHNYKDNITHHVSDY